MATIFVYSYRFDTPVGDLAIAEMDGEICRVLFESPMTIFDELNIWRLFNTELLNLNHNVEVRETDKLKCAAQQLSEYFSGARPVFDIPIQISGIHFSSRVYRELLKIPAGQTRSYKDIAIACGNPKASRAVGLINKNNPIPIFIPCHRVIGSNGKLIGYGGGLPLKQYLIDLEKAYYL